MEPTVERVDVIDGFGEEWTRFDQTGLTDDERIAAFETYFEVFPWNELPADATGFDLGCGSGRWAAHVAPRVDTLHCIDPSDAIDVARRNLSDHDNVVFHRRTAAALPFEPDSMDFGYSLGVLHHVADTEGALRAAVEALKPGAPLLVYLYYAFDNRPRWFRALWQLSDVARRLIARQPSSVRQLVCDGLAGSVYYPLARGAAAAERLGMNVAGWPLSAYRHRSFYAMRTDSLDRFGTRLEKRYTRQQMETLMRDAGLTDIRFGTSVFWCAVGTRAR
ncbi:MAG: class I SAM-dependent methyltransferase [Deltaproteobacteria bacterium]|nr:class I SAM-dependent methyltransferase [Deltaproteobacteria bacterium]MBW1903711.1 class I SAM-dependent methyltransferase [Deltaproteobacteria bacterium]MBW2158807.1 class I SAM-dependent methyltransferase [Deltaproteobacteria bacterium]MBW2375064.1 class I SAM-dependent methyltransferase [Deltaproteobacteria bacterium]MBW2585477.1 class I SAM-dependent methyltransferase [Deltaproteobacteria bacterium]